MCGTVDVDERLCESRRLDVARYGCEDGEHPDDTVVCRREQASEEDAKDEVE